MLVPQRSSMDKRALLLHCQSKDLVDGLHPDHLIVNPHLVIQVGDLQDHEDSILNLGPTKSWIEFSSSSWMLPS